MGTPCPLQSMAFVIGLRRIFVPKIEEDDIGNIWLQLDGATCHTAEPKFDVLRPVFEDHIITAELMSFGHRGAAI